MPEVYGDIQDFLTNKQARAIPFVPTTIPDQRGPTCGFYALAFVMNYWHERSKKLGGQHKALEAPLTPRTNTTLVISESKDVKAQNDRREKMHLGKFTSLRQYGKFKMLTAFGSVFNADDLVNVAKGQGSQFDGHYDGKVIEVTADNFTEKVGKFIDLQIPVIVPYDAVGEGGEPGLVRGESAHWVVIFGIFKDNNVDYAIYFTWGSFYYAPLDRFGESNAQLTSNSYRKLQKLEVRNKSGSVVERDYMTQQRMEEHILINRTIKVISAPVSNPEFNDPTKGGKRNGKKDDKDGRDKLMVGGLRGKIVIVFRFEDKQQFDLLS